MTKKDYQLQELERRFAHIYDRIEEIYNGKAIVERDGKLGVINLKGKVVVPLMYDYISDFHYKYNLAAAFFEDKGCLVNDKCQQITPLIYDDIAVKFYRELGAPHFSCGLVKVCIDEKYGFVDTAGQLVIPTIYDCALDFTKDGFTVVKQNGKWGMLNTEGKAVIDIKYDLSLTLYDKGYIVTMLDKKVVFLDYTGKVLSEAELDDLFSKKRLTGIKKSNTFTQDFKIIREMTNTNKTLFEAVETGDIAGVQKALEEEKINATSYYGAKSIIFAAENGHVEMLKMLLESGKNIPRVSFWSNRYNVAFSALSRAARNGRTDILQLLLEYGANTVKKDMREAFVEALMSGNREMTKLLLDAGANVNIKDEKGMTPLMYAVLFPTENQEMLVEWLLTAGAYVNIKRETSVREGKTVKKKIDTALTYAEELGNDKIVAMLKKAKEYCKK